jgi:large subunit ribosomal protein L13
MKTHVTKASEIKREWHLIDFKDQNLGRTASFIAELLIGKHKANYAPNLDAGDYVVVVNAEKLSVTGKKRSDKMYRRHSGYPGGFKEYTLDQVMVKDPRKVIKLAVSGMLPKNKLRDPRLKRLKIFTGQEHPYEKLIRTDNKG